MRYLIFLFFSSCQLLAQNPVNKVVEDMKLADGKHEEFYSNGKLVK